MDFSGSSTQATLVGRDGKPLGSNDNPTFGFGIDPQAERFNPLTLVGGHWASGPGEVVIDAAAAEDGGLEVGDSVGVATDATTRLFRVVGIARFGNVDSLGGATIAVFDVRTAQQLLAKDGFDAISVAASPGTSEQELLAEIRPLLPDTLEAKTGAEQAAEDGREVSEFVSYFRYFLLAFGGIALFVGAFVIFNTLSITVAQRTRELATLRTLGASRRQVLRSVVLEASLIGAVASLFGLFAGLGLAQLLSAAFGWLGVTLPEAGTVFATRTVVVSLVAGTVIAVLAGLVPALRATRVPPIAAVREGAALPRGRASRLAPVLALGLIGLGGALLAYALFGSDLGVSTVLISMAGGCLLLFVGVALVSSRLVTPLAAVVGWPGRRVGGIAGQLASENAVRNPGRTAATAAALMVGLALVTLVAVLGKGLGAASEVAIEQQVRSEYVVTSDDNSETFAPAAADALSALPGVELVTAVRTDRARVGEDAIDVSGIDPATIAAGYRFTWSSGSGSALAALDRAGAIVRKGFAEEHDLAVGSRFTLLTPDGRTVGLTVRGIVAPPRLDSLLGSVVVTQQAFDEAFPRPRNGYAFANVAGEPSAATTAALEDALGDYPGAKLETRAAFVEGRAADFRQFLNLLYVLLAFSVVVSLFGMVNTLVLSVFERTREIGMLRAVGMTRRQARRMIRHESVVTALIGAVLGIGLGILLAALVTTGISTLEVPFELPVGTLAAFALVGIAGGIAAAVLPARRAARLDPLEALQYE
jgi:putative ABC transport system permease protein